MNISYIRRTDQKVSYANLHLDRLKKLLVDNCGSGLSGEVGAYEQAVSFHLMLICDAFRCEIASDYHVNSTKVDSFVSLNVKLESKGVVCQQCEVLAEMELNPSSWLAFIEKNYIEQWGSAKVLEKPLQRPHLSANEYDVSDSVRMIDFQDVTCEPLVQQFQTCFNELQDAIRQYRNLMQEW